MKHRIITLITAALMLLVGVTAVAPAADATHDGTRKECATWGCTYHIDWRGGRWHAEVQDIKTDGYCVELWTLEGNNKADRIARSCGGVVYGSAPGGGYEDSRGMRMYRDDGRYLTINPDATP